MIPNRNRMYASECVSECVYVRAFVLAHAAAAAAAHWSWDVAE